MRGRFTAHIAMNRPLVGTIASRTGLRSAHRPLGRHLVLLVADDDDEPLPLAGGERERRLAVLGGEADQRDARAAQRGGEGADAFGEVLERAQGAGDLARDRIDAERRQRADLQAERERLAAVGVERLGDRRALGLEAGRAVVLDVAHTLVEARRRAQRAARRHVGTQRRGDDGGLGHHAAAAIAGSRPAPTAAPPGQPSQGTERRGFSMPTADMSPPSATSAAVTSIARRKASTEASSSAVRTAADAPGGAAESGAGSPATLSSIALEYAAA